MFSNLRLKKVLCLLNKYFTETSKIFIKSHLTYILLKRAKYFLLLNKYFTVPRGFIFCNCNFILIQVFNFC